MLPTHHRRRRPCFVSAKTYTIQFEFNDLVNHGFKSYLKFYMLLIWTDDDDEETMARAREYDWWCANFPKMELINQIFALMVSFGKSLSG